MYVDLYDDADRTLLVVLNESIAIINIALLLKTNVYIRRNQGFSVIYIHFSNAMNLSYTGWPIKNATILIRNFNDILHLMPLIFAVLDRIFFSK